MGVISTERQVASFPSAFAILPRLPPLAVFHEMRLHQTARGALCAWRSGLTALPPGLGSGRSPKCHGVMALLVFPWSSFREALDQIVQSGKGPEPLSSLCCQRLLSPLPSPSTPE